MAHFPGTPPPALDVRYAEITDVIGVLYPARALGLPSVEAIAFYHCRNLSLSSCSVQYYGRETVQLSSADAVKYIAAWTRLVAANTDVKCAVTTLMLAVACSAPQIERAMTGSWKCGLALEVAVARAVERGADPPTPADSARLVHDLAGALGIAARGRALRGLRAQPARGGCGAPRQGVLEAILGIEPWPPADRRWPASGAGSGGAPLLLYRVHHGGAQTAHKLSARLALGHEHDARSSI